MPDPEEKQLETGPYILRSLIRDVQLSESGDDEGVRITCVEVWKENLYIGTSHGEVLHYVQLPPASDDDTATPATFIPASRLTPPVNQHVPNVGIQQLLLLPAVSKACILSSNTLNFYTLPELSPAFPQLKPLTCGWVGGVDRNHENPGEEDDAGRGVGIMMCLRNKIRLVSIGETAAVKERDIEFGGCLSTVRRGNIACVADGRSYALVDVVAQQKIPLLPISSLDEQQQAGEGSGPAQQEDVWPSAAGGAHSRSSSVVGQKERWGVQERGHNRSTSLGIFRTESPLGDSPRNSMVGNRHGFDVPAIFNRQTSPRPHEERRSSLGPDVAKPLPAPPPEDATSATGQRSGMPLRPVIASPNDSEFLLVTGTGPEEPGLGMFVNLDGEIVRGTMEFSSFPESIVTDGRGIDLSVSMSGADTETPEEGHVLAVVQREVDGVMCRDVEIQRWDLDPTQGGTLKQWLGVASPEAAGLGIRRIVEDISFDLPEIVDLLAQKAIRLSSDPSSPTNPNEPVLKREKEERAYFQRMAQARTGILTWSASQIHWTLRNPLVLRLDAQLRAAQGAHTIAPQRAPIERLLNDLRGQRSATELEFYTLSYIRQKAALLLFIDLVLQTKAGNLAFERDKRATEDALVDSEIDPRFVLHFLPGISSEILAKEEGIWVQGGIQSLLLSFLDQWSPEEIPAGPLQENLLKVVKRFLLIWRRKRGNPSVEDGDHVFPTVDAALLRILLLLDADSPPGSASAGSVRAELNALVDSGVECFPRAVELLESNQRLYILSRLYQSRKNASKVLETWRRIIDGAPDKGGEFPPEIGEGELKTYLTKLRNRNLVEEYGAWLASRNPRLGVQVFADEGGRTVWTPSEALGILRAKAPSAVKEYLEYLVFSKKQSQHINELISYYLDIVVSALSDPQSSAEETLKVSYETYAALHPPKPTYARFVEENSPGEGWSEARLRLLQLLGEEGEGYDVERVLARLERFEDALVPEMIILNGRRGRHDDAIRLLTRGLGDFDTAISYCLRGGYASSSSSDSSSDKQTRESEEQRRKLFHTLLLSLLSLPDLTQRIERTAELLDRFSAFFSIDQVLEHVPEGWSVDIVGPFLVRALGRLVRERNEGRVVRALYGSESLRTNVERIGVVEEKRPMLETEHGLVEMGRVVVS